jgi:DNA-binding IscR family transcriptional regulator
MWIVVEKGKKAEGDRVIRLTANNEKVSLAEILQILDVIFKAEEECYPKPHFQGSCLFMKAILEVYSGIPLEKVLANYGLKKASKTVVVEKLDSSKPKVEVKPVQKLHEVLSRE